MPPLRWHGHKEWEVDGSRTSDSSDQNTDDRCGHEVCHGSSEHGAQAKPGKFVAAVRSKGTNAADLDADRAEVRESAKRKGSDGEGARGEEGFLPTQERVSDDLVDDHARAQQVADDAGVFPWDADQPCDGRKDEAENRVEARREPGKVVLRKPVMNAAKDAVYEGDQRQERDEHDDDVEGQTSAVDCAAGDCPEEIFFLVLHLFRHVDYAFGGGLFGLRHKHLGDEDGAGGGHDNGSEQMLCL